MSTLPRETPVPVFNAATFLAAKLTNKPVTTWSWDSLTDVCSFFWEHVSSKADAFFGSFFTKILSDFRETCKGIYTSIQGVEPKWSKYKEWAKLVVDITAYRPYKTRKQPTHVSSDTIIDACLQAGTRFEGPVSYVLLKPRKELEDILGRPAPVLWLFGDVHTIRLKCQPSCEEIDKCLTFYSTLPFGGTTRGSFLPHLETIGKSHHIVTDYFLEWWPNWNNADLPALYKLGPSDNPISDYTARKVAKETVENQPSSIMDNYVDVFDCISKTKTNCHVPYLRVHSGDTRFRPDDFNSLFDLQKYNDVDKWIAVCNRVMGLHEASDIERTKVHLRCLQIIVDRIKLGSHGFAKAFLQDEKLRQMLQMHSKTVFELIQVPTSLQTSMIEYLTDFDTNYNHSDQAYPDFSISHCKTFMEAYMTVKQWFDEQIKKDSNTVSFFHLFGLEGTMDMYWLSRVLKSPLGGLPSQLACLYVGNAHVINYVRYLTTCMPYYDVAAVFTDRELTKSMYERTKCVNMQIPVTPDSQWLEGVWFITQNNRNRTMSTFPFMYYMCKFALAQSPTNREYYVNYIQQVLSWRDFYYDFASPSRYLKEDAIVLTLLRFATPEVLNTEQLCLIYFKTIWLSWSWSTPSVNVQVRVYVNRCFL